MKFSWNLFKFMSCLMFIGPCVIVIAEEYKTNLMSLAILFYFLCTQHVLDINISISRSLWLCCWITTSVVLFLFRCVLEIWRSWVWVVSVLQASACNTDTTQVQAGWMSFQTKGCVTAFGPSCLHLTSIKQQLENQMAYMVSNAIIVSSWWWA